jgi:hypothetical protein
VSPAIDCGQDLLEDAVMSHENGPQSLDEPFDVISEVVKVQSFSSEA